MRVTMNKINTKAGALGYVLDKGDGYFYYRTTGDAPPLYDSMVCTCHLSSLTVDEWIAALQDKIAETEFHRGAPAREENGVFVLSKKVD